MKGKDKRSEGKERETDNKGRKKKENVGTEEGKRRETIIENETKISSLRREEKKKRKVFSFV